VLTEDFFAAPFTEQRLQRQLRDAARWQELCRQAERRQFPRGILDDAENMGAGALELHIDEALAAATRKATPPVLQWRDECLARHWIDRYAAGIDPEPQLDRILECLGATVIGEVVESEAIGHATKFYKSYDETVDALPIGTLVYAIPR
jgi:hypothetical protein